LVFLSAAATANNNYIMWMCREIFQQPAPAIGWLQLLIQHMTIQKTAAAGMVHLQLI